MAGKHSHDKITVPTNVMNVLTDLVWVKSGGGEHPSYPSPVNAIDLHSF